MQPAALGVFLRSLAKFGSIHGKRAIIKVLPVAQLGPDFLMLEKADDFEGPAKVILSLDGETHSRDVQLQCGSTGNQKTISFL